MESDPKNAANTPQGVPALAQPVAAPLSRAAIFLIVTMKPEPQARATVRSFCGDLSGIFRAVETMNRYHGLTAGFEAGELFLTYRSVGVDDLMRWASPAHARD